MDPQQCRAARPWTSATIDRGVGGGRGELERHGVTARRTPGEVLCGGGSRTASRDGIQRDSYRGRTGGDGHNTSGAVPCGLGGFAVPITIGVAGYADGSRSVPRQWGDRRSTGVNGVIERYAPEQEVNFENWPISFS